MLSTLTIVILSVLLVAGIVVLRQHSSPGVGSRVGQYRLEKLIGEGGMGLVYRASHARLHRPAAIKFLPPDRSSELDVARFEREVQNTARLSHPNTIAIYDYGRAARGLFFYTMELLDGLNLKQLVERHGPISDARTAYIIRQVCGSLAEAHGNGLVHRDVKPSNIFLCEVGGHYDFVKVLDFGVAKEIDQDSGNYLTRPGALVGTPAYASPEMVRGATVDPRADIYATGLVMYFLMVGRDLFEGDSTVEVLQQHIEHEPTRLPRSLGRLAHVVKSCIAMSPKDRPQSAIELRGCIDAVGLDDWRQEDAKAWWETVER